MLITPLKLCAILIRYKEKQICNSHNWSASWKTSLICFSLIIMPYHGRQNPTIYLINNDRFKFQNQMNGMMLRVTFYCVICHWSEVASIAYGYGWGTDEVGYLWGCVHVFVTLEALYVCMCGIRHTDTHTASSLAIVHYCLISVEIYTELRRLGHERWTLKNVTPHWT